jgi:hypothetical protein
MRALISISALAAPLALLGAGCHEVNHCGAEGTVVGSDYDCAEDGGVTETWGRRPPPRPEDGADWEIGRQVFALRDVVLDQHTLAYPWYDIGYDLDGYQTATAADAVTDGAECVPPAALSANPYADWTETRPPPVMLDGNDGIDNVFGERLYLLHHAAGSSDDAALETTIRLDQESGRGTWILVLDGWNGEANDPRVTVSLVHAAGGTPCSHVESVEFDDAYRLVLAEDGTTPAPAPGWWSGGDCWWVRGDSLAMDGSTPSTLDDLAYVSEGTLVVRLPDRVALPFFAGPLGSLMHLTDAVLTARIERTSTSAGLAGLHHVTVAGRWALSDVAQDLTHLAVCGVVRSVVQNQVDQMADLRSNPQDAHSLNQPCNALSVGFLFQAGVSAALAGGDVAASIGPSEPLPEHCND